MEKVSWLAYAINGLLAGILVFWVFYAAASGRKTRTPSKLQVLMEMLVDAMASQFRGILGPHGEKHLPLPMALFFYILFCNILGQIPGFTSATAATGTTMALAAIVFVYVQYIGITSNGLLGYLKHFLGPQLVEVKKGPGVSPVSIILAVLMTVLVAALFLPIELITEWFAKPFSLGMRLYGNIFAEDMINTLGVNTGNSIWHIPVQFPVYLLQLFTDLIQAFVFSLLACVYISLISPHNDEEHDGHVVDAHEQQAHAEHVHLAASA